MRAPERPPEPQAARPAPCGSWRSPVTAELVAGAGVVLSAPRVDEGPEGATVYWLEGRPIEGGRQVVVAWRPGGEPADVTPPGFDVRTRVHEYGGGAYAVAAGTVVFSNLADQRLWRQDGQREPVPLTPEASPGTSLRYADGCFTPDRRHLVCVREAHEAGEVRNELVAVPVAGGEPVVVASGRDFYAAPRVSPDGTLLAFLTWDHPRMPWDGTELVLGALDARSGPPRLLGAAPVAGGPAESVNQPRFAPDGSLLFASDRTGYYNLFRLRVVPGQGAAASEPEPLAPMEAECSGPQWSFDLATYAVLPDGRVMFAFSERGMDRLALLDPSSGGTPVELETGLTSLSAVVALGPASVVVIGASPREPPAVLLVEVPRRAGGRPGRGTASGAAPAGAPADDAGTALEPTVLRRSRPLSTDPRYLSEPVPLEELSPPGSELHGFFYPPANADHRPLDDELPPLVVFCHGGPTSATTSALNLTIQFFTSRGLAVADVNYGGSTGYGRAFRERLRGAWGVVDVDDCVAAAQALVTAGLCDGRRLAIRGGSAGGWTTLCALCFRDVFAAGASYYGVADAEALARETHKFESHYLDGLIGPLPEARDRYRERSPAFHAERCSGALIVFQGLDDPIVPPNQAEAMVAALRAKGLPCALLTFPGEQHGFRRAETLKRCLEAELAFYGQVFGFRPADPVPPLDLLAGEGGGPGDEGGLP
jgi:dipeptidyl aminopeptidase/acylaminoacyl peptidase